MTNKIHILQIKPAAYMEMISSMRPNLFTTLADEVPAWVSDKRNRISVDRTLRWLDDCLTLNLVKPPFFCLHITSLSTYYFWLFYF